MKGDSGVPTLVVDEVGRGISMSGAEPSFRHHRVFGGLEVRVNGRVIDLGPPKQRAVLAILLLEAGRVVSSERLVELLWDDAPKALVSLQTYVSNLRRVLEPDRRPRDPATVLLTQAPGYRLDVDRREVDALRFEDLVAEGQARIRAADPTGAAAALDEALALWTAPPLPELAHEPFVVEAAARLSSVRQTAWGLAAQARLDLGHHVEAVGLLEPAVAAHPLDERLHALLALGLYRSGRQAEALRVVDRVRRALADTAGLDLGSELRDLEADLLSHAPTLEWHPSTPPLPTIASEPEGPVLLGRDAEMAALTGALSGAAAGRGTAAVVLGEPGIGKTRLVEELATAARQSGFVTAWARCPESGATPSFWSATHLADQVREAGAVERALVPPDESHQEAEVAGAVFALYQAVVTTLRSATSPLLLVIDDLQWADADSLRLLAHVAGELARLPVLVVVTVRPLEDDSGAALVDALGALSRTTGVVQVPLSGLERAVVAEWLGARTDVDVPDDVAALVHDRTGGNPLFVKELSELLAAEGRLADASAARAASAIPPGVQFVVRRRVARLPATTQQLLTVASVVGRGFELAVVATVAEETVDATLDALAPALDAGLVFDEGGGRFRFSHALVCDALAAEVNAVRSARIHAAVARTYAQRIGPVLGSSAALVAHHALAGAMAGTVELAVDASTEAARQASDQFGYEDAAGHWARVVDALGAFCPGDLPTRIDALCNLAAARFEADLVESARSAALEAMDLAEAAGDVAALGRAAALLGSPHLWPNQSYGTVDPRCIAALRRTVELVDPDDLATRALVLGALAVELTYGDRAEIEAVRCAAVEAARASGDPNVLGRVLLNASGPLEPTKLDERRASASEVLELVEAHGLDDHIALVARFQLALTHYESADHEGAAAHTARCREVADRIGGGPVRAQLGWFQGARALVHGRYEEAQALCSEATLLYRRTRRMDADLMEMAQVAAIAADRGDLDVAMPRIRAAAAASPRYGRLTAEFSAWLATEAGWHDVAASVIAAIDTSVPFADDYTMLSAATYGLHTRVSLGDLAGASDIMSQLEPFEGRWAATGSGGGSAGLVELALARAAVLLGDTERGRRLFDQAVAGHERLRAPAWLARSLLYQGQFLLDSAGRVDRDRGEAALRRAASLAEDHGLVYVARQVALARTGR